MRGKACRFHSRAQSFPRGPVLCGHMLTLTLAASLTLATGEAPSLTSYAESIDQRLVSVLAGDGAYTVHTRYRTVQVGRLFWDDEVEQAFAGVPAAVASIHQARLDNLRGAWLTLGSFAASAAGLGLVLTAALLGGPIGLLVAAMGAELVALILGLVGQAFRRDAEAGLLRAADEYNHGLLAAPPDPPAPAAPPPGAGLPEAPAARLTVLRF